MLGELAQQCPEVRPVLLGWQAGQYLVLSRPQPPVQVVEQFPARCGGHELKAELRRRLTELGMDLLLASPLRENPPTPPGELQTFIVRTGAGAEVTADIWFRCHGVTPVSDYLAGGLVAARRADGFVAVTPYLQVTGQDRVFALGDDPAG